MGCGRTPYWLGPKAGLGFLDELGEISYEDLRREISLNIEGFIRSAKSFSGFFEKAKELTKKERGDTFERVVQLHLQSKPKYASELDEVWQLHEVPQDVRKHLKLPDADESIDLIAKHVDGSYWAITKTQGLTSGQNQPTRFWHRSNDFAIASRITYVQNFRFR